MNSFEIGRCIPYKVSHSLSSCSAPVARETFY